MQDVYKFRAWDKEKNVLVYDIENCFDDWDCQNFYDYIINDRYIVEQCIGLKDKTGKLIYDGDIVVRVYSDGTEERKSVVKYGNFNCSCCDGVYGWYLDYGDIRDIEDYIVIGNVHENRDLLENKDV